MSSEIIERVARAICWKNGMNPDLSLGGDGVNFLWHEYDGQARAAIEAMRDLTQPMLDVGTKDTGWGDCEESEIQFRWNAMISAALSSPAEDM